MQGARTLTLPADRPSEGRMRHRAPAEGDQASVRKPQGIAPLTTKSVADFIKRCAIAT
jgi:hypothetical protein